MKIEELKIGDIKPYENNPRNNEGAVDAVADVGCMGISQDKK